MNGFSDEMNACQVNFGNGQVSTEKSDSTKTLEHHDEKRLENCRRNSNFCVSNRFTLARAPNAKKTGDKTDQQRRQHIINAVLQISGPQLAQLEQGLADTLAQVNDSEYSDFMDKELSIYLILSNFAQLKKYIQQNEREKSVTMRADYRDFVVNKLETFIDEVSLESFQQRYAQNGGVMNEV